MATITKKTAVETLATAELEIAQESHYLKNAVLNGKVYEKSFSTKAEGWDRTSLEFKVQIDFAGVSQQQLITWAAAKLVIDLQKQLRTLPLEFARTLSRSVVYRKASEMGLMFEDPNAAARKARESVKVLSIEELKAEIAAREAAAKK